MNSFSEKSFHKKQTLEICISDFNLLEQISQSKCLQSSPWKSLYTYFTGILLFILHLRLKAWEK